jgi:hypothetical protein
MVNTNIKLAYRDRIGLVREVMKTISDLNIMVYSHKADVFQDNCKHIQVATFKLSLEELPQDRLSVLLKRFSKLKGYISADVTTA